MLGVSLEFNDVSLKFLETNRNYLKVDYEFSTQRQGVSPSGEAIAQLKWRRPLESMLFQLLPFLHPPQIFFMAEFQRNVKSFDKFSISKENNGARGVHSSIELLLTLLS